MIGSFQVQAKRRQMMSERVVQVARDPFAFSQPAGIREQFTRRPQFAIGAGKLAASACFARSQKAAEQRQHLEPDIGSHQGQRRMQWPSHRQNGAHQYCLYRDPKQGAAK